MKVTFEEKQDARKKYKCKKSRKNEVEVFSLIMAGSVPTGAFNLGTQAVYVSNTPARFQFTRTAAFYSIRRDTLYRGNMGAAYQRRFHGFRGNICSIGTADIDIYLYPIAGVLLSRMVYFA